MVILAMSTKYTATIVNQGAVDALINTLKSIIVDSISTNIYSE